MRSSCRSALFLLYLNLAFLLPTARGASISLDGDWNFLADPEGTLTVQQLASATNVRPTTIPSSWQSQFADLRDYSGVAWYWRTVSAEAPPQGQVALLRFGAVDYLAAVYVNGQKAGSHEGGYLPFEFEVTSLLRPGENQIAVRVVDPGANPSEVEGIRYAEIPHGKQNWYVQTSGLWQSVELDLRPRMHLGTVHISAGADGNFKIDVPLVNLSAAGETKDQAYVGAEIRDTADKVIWKESLNLNPGQASAGFAGRVADPQVWTLGAPTLYTLHVWLSSGDTENYHFGFRTFEARDGKFYLNGRVLYLRGALDQDFYPDTFYTPPSLEYLKKEMQQAKALGLNLLRCHIKAPDPRYLQAADEVGILVWYDVPNWDKLTPDSQRRGLATLRGMVERDWNHPSVVMLSILNESWGADLKSAADRQWLKQAYQETKKLVPGWLVVDNSPCCDNFHVATDLADFHHYNAVPEHAGDFDRFVMDQATRPGWLFSPYGDATPKGNEPLMLSEFGNWGLPRPPENAPWWFGRDFRGMKFTVPEGVEKRFADYQYSSLFPNLNALAEACQWHEYEALKYQIEAIRSYPGLQGYVITEFTDLNWEANGLLDMWRRPKVFSTQLAKLQQDDLIIIRTSKRNFSIGEKVPAEVLFSHYSIGAIAGASVTWQLQGTSLAGTIPAPPVSPPSVTKMGQIEFIAPDSSAPAKRLLKVALVSAGKALAENSVELYFYPPKSPELPPPVSFVDPAGRLRRLVNEMRARNYLSPTGAEAFPVLIASQFDDQVKKTLRDGGHVILLTTDRATLAPGLEIVPRTGRQFPESLYEGNWITSIPWVRKDQEPLKAIGFNVLEGFESQAVTPTAVVQGIPPQNFKDVLAGMFFSWIHANVGTLVQAKCGKGKLLICTFSLGTTYGSDPYATYLLDALINYVISNFAPEFEIPL
jgi:hypothetical protein